LLLFIFYQPLFDYSKFIFKNLKKSFNKLPNQKRREKNTKHFLSKALAFQKVLSASGRAGRLLMGKYFGHRLIARPELDNTFCTDSA